MRQGVRIGVDVGTVRIGIARTDPEGILAVPVETVKRQDDGSELARILEIIDEFDAIEIVVGLPRHLKGAEGISAKGARRYARRIAEHVGDKRVAMVDERLSSNQAHDRLRQSGMSTRDHRDVIDQVAAQVILETSLEMERMGNPEPGQTIEVQPPREGNQ